MSRNAKIDSLVQEMQSKINKPDDVTFEWIPYNQFRNIIEIDKGGSQNISDEFLNEIKGYSNKVYSSDYSLSINGLSQDPDTKDYIMVLSYAAGNILLIPCFLSPNTDYMLSISDMGLCGEVGNTDEKNIYGVMSYIVSEVLRGKLYTQAADIYSFGMVIYFIATGRQPFANRAHDGILALDICNGIRSKINEQGAPECYVDLMKRCRDVNPDKKPKATEVEELIDLFHKSCRTD
ncbi:kinase-like domain-containing protein [Rhizophagus clarus]|uniref:Kinase-like domain-containing protein n=1 Tax=Rhizophagus clarus TaxID=94130 RepID=A0A8H3QV80_9GLOM|nr:kinase-like domain-containing protein [Rhizophagus clarus]